MDEFNECLRQVLTWKINASIVFSFSEKNERHDFFFKKIFSFDNFPKMNKLELNQPTEASIYAVLKEIRQRENFMNVSDDTLKAIRDFSSKDLACAIT